MNNDDALREKTSSQVGTTLGNSYTGSTVAVMLENSVNSQELVRTSSYVNREKIETLNPYIAKVKPLDHTPSVV